ncbi:MAG: molybdopterin-binding protein [Bacteroidales bacterium]
MSQKGNFCHVVRGGSLKAGGGLEYHKLITIGDLAYAGIYEDKSREVVMDLLFNFLENQGIDFHIEKSIVPDEIGKVVLAAIHDNKADFVFTTGSVL